MLKKFISLSVLVLDIIDLATKKFNFHTVRREDIGKEEISEPSSRGVDSRLKNTVLQITSTKLTASYGRNRIAKRYPTQWAQQCGEQVP